MFHSLKARIFFLICLVLGLLAMLVLYFTHRDVEDAMFRAEQRSARNVLDLVELNIRSGHNNLVQYRVDAVQAYRKTLREMAVIASHGLDSMLALTDQSAIDQDKAVRVAMTWLDTVPFGEGLRFLVFDAQGKVVGHPGNALHGYDLNQLRDFKSAPLADSVRSSILRQGEASSIFYWPGHGGVEHKRFGFFLMYSPMDWIIGISVDIEELEREGERKLQELLENLRHNFARIRIAENGFVLLFNAHGDMLIHPDGLEWNLGEAVNLLTGRFLLEDFRDAADNRNRESIRFALQTPVEHAAFDQIQEQEAFVGYFRALDWYVATVADVEEVGAPAKSVVSRLSLIIAGIFFASLGMGLVLTTRITKPLNALANYAKALPGRDFSGPLEVRPEIARLPDRHKCEVGRLAAALMYMEVALNENVRSLIDTTAVKERVQGELSERVRSEEKLLLQTRLQELLMQIASTYINLPLGRLNSAIETSLGELGRLAGADCAYLFDYDFESRICINTHEWCAEGIASRIESLQEVPLTMVPEMVEAHQDGRVLFINDVRALPPDSEFRKLLKDKGISSLFTVPLMDGEICRGFVGFDFSREFSLDAQEIIRLLQIFALMLVNVRNRGKVEKALQLSRETAEAASLAKSRFLANMSHEIRTPMNAILGFANVLERDSSLTPSQAKHVRTILRSGEHLLRLINDILDMAKIEAGRTVLVAKDFSPNALMREMDNLFRPAASAKGLFFRMESDRNLPSVVHGDQNKLAQILINLLDNAVKFTRQGVIILRCAVEATAHGQESPVINLVWEVEDTGPGIDERETEQLFDPFHQTATGVEAGGTGLGLSISRGYARLMGGDLTFTSRKGQGSCFRFRIQVREAAEQFQAKPRPREVVGLAFGPNAQPAAQEGREADAWRILAVDDKPENLALIASLLQPVGFAVREAANGAEALRIFETWSPHAVLMDMRMPVMDGFEAVRRIKASAAGQSAFVVAVTAGAFMDSRQEIMDAGVDAYLAKPYQAEELFAVLEQGLGLQYVYAEEFDSGSGQRSGDTSYSEIPSPGSHHLTQATVQAVLNVADRGDIVGLQSLIREVFQEDPAAARILEDMAERFDYQGIKKFMKTPRGGEVRAEPVGQGDQ
ncbi:ATP-binding protein [Desulfonatronum parangueonense]